MSPFVTRAQEILAVTTADDLGPDLSALTGDILPDWYDEWVIIERERFRQLRLHVLEVTRERLTQTGKFGRAVEAGIAAVACEPFRESAQRVLIAAYLAEGNQAEALRQYESYRRVLWGELRLRPSAHMVKLMQQLHS